MSNMFNALTHSQLGVDGLAKDDAGLRRRISESMYSSRSHKTWAEKQASRQGLDFAQKLFGMNAPTNNSGDAIDVIQSPMARLDRKSLSIVAQLQEELGNNKYAVRKPIVRPDPVRNEAAMEAAAKQAVETKQAANAAAPDAGQASSPATAAGAKAAAAPDSLEAAPAQAAEATFFERLLHAKPALLAKSKTPALSSDNAMIRGVIKREFITSPSYEAMAKDHKDELRQKVNNLKEESFLQEKDPELGALSAQFESGAAGVAAIGYDRVGGTSYGKYQLSSRAGTMRRFISYLRDHEPEWSERLAKSGNANTRGRRGLMPNTWRQIAKENPARFEQLQEAFILRTNYQPAKQAIQAATNIDVAEFSPVLQDVLHSTAVQHGPGGASRIFIRAIRRTKSTPTKMQEEALIEEVYRTRKHDFGSSSRRVRRAVRARLTAEKDMAIDLLRQNMMVAENDV